MLPLLLLFLHPLSTLFINTVNTNSKILFCLAAGDVLAAISSLETELSSAQDKRALQQQQHQRLQQELREATRELSQLHHQKDDLTDQIVHSPNKVKKTLVFILLVLNKKLLISIKQLICWRFLSCMCPCHCLSARCK